MKTLTSGFAAAIATKRGARPVWILTTTVDGTAYYISDIALTISGWQASPITTLPWVATWGQITEQVSGALNEIRIADFSVSLIADPDDAANIAHLATAHNLEASPCSLYLWFRDLDASTDPPQEFFRGYVRDVALPDEFTVQITLEDEASRLDAPYGEILSQETYPACLANHVGRLLPVVFGRANNVMPPVAKVDGTTYYYYAFGDVLDSVARVRRKNSDGTVTTLTASSSAGANNYLLYTGKTGDIYTGFTGKAVIRTAASTGTAITATQQATYRPDVHTMVSGTDYTGSWTGYLSNGTDTNDSSYCGLLSAGTYWYKMFFYPTVSTSTRVKARFKLYCSGATFTIELKNQAGTSLGTYSGGDVANGTVIDTGWFTAANATEVTATITIVTTTGDYFWIYSGWLDLEYSYTTGTSYVANPTEIMVDAVRDILPGNAITTRPTVAPDTSTMTWGASPHDEAKQRDADVDTYGDITNANTGDRNQWWNHNADIYHWDPANGVPRYFRAFARIEGTFAASALLQGMTFNGDYVVSQLSFSGTYTGGPTIYAPWTACPGNIDNILHLYLGTKSGSSGVKIYDIGIQFLLSDINQPDDMAEAILGTTVTGTWSALPASYQTAGAITDSRRLIDWLDYLAFQCRCWFRISCGVARLIWRPDTLTSVATIAAVRVDVGRKVWSRKRAPKTEIVNAITLRYGRDYSLSGDEAYSAIASATDTTSITEFGKLSRDELFRSDFIQQIQHAESVRDFYLTAQKSRYWLEELEVFLDSIALEFGDIVELPDGRIGTVVSVGIQPGSIDVMDKIRLTVMV